MAQIIGEDIFFRGTFETPPNIINIPPGEKLLSIESNVKDLAWATTAKGSDIRSYRLRCVAGNNQLPIPGLAKLENFPFQISTKYN